MRLAVAWVAAALCAYSGPAWAAQPWEYEPLEWAKFTEPTARYPHGVLGDYIEYGALVLKYLPGHTKYTIRLPQDRVFEDIKPRLVDIDQDSKREVMVVESHKTKGARLALYNGGGLIAATPYIGTRFRWLAPLGAADLDGDGHIEVAYIDRPHLAKTLRVWRFQDGALIEIATLPGLTNHKIGWDFIPGGVRTCDEQPEMILASANWSRIMAVSLIDGTLHAKDIGPYTDPESLNTALRCP
ncbi:FG-GAP repeat domain-containing protein [Roseovarius phycicola]|uniref:VCBS repeat-containing protein n=1 Tax=Roseovarius phycicola TaxID=3080976 RepID=A0ABZ2HIM6_9RHOB